MVAIAAAAVAVGEAAVYWAHPRPSTPEARDSVSVAFAPFANTSGDPGAAAIAARVSSGILASLGRSGAMRPIPISAAAGGVPTEICTKLKTGRLLRGSVRAEGSRLTVKAELFRSSGQIRLWTSTYERDAARDSGDWDRIAAEIASTAERKILDTP
jgi:TolB-like protein